MKHSSTIHVGDKTYELYYTLGDMRRVEKELGRSLLSIVLAGYDAVALANIDFIMASLRYGLHGNNTPREENELYDFIDMWCETETLDTISAMLIKAYLDSGFFIPRNGETKATTPKKASPSPA